MLESMVSSSVNLVGLESRRDLLSCAEAGAGAGVGWPASTIGSAERGPSNFCGATSTTEVATLAARELVDAAGTMVTELVLEAGDATGCAVSVDPSCMGGRAGTGGTPSEMAPLLLARDGGPGLGPY